ncbi:MAG: hypothetical protein KDD66_10385 [Bdellovibrionales bacterium]|nr:hypothetical protein [Bdellovibrionales bacterium]
MYIKPIEQRPLPQNDKRTERKSKQSENSFAETLESAVAVDSIEITRYNEEDEPQRKKQRPRKGSKKDEKSEDSDSNLDITA